MRLLVELEPTKRFVPDEKYFNKLQGFIYSQLRKTKFSQLHDTKGYKFFSFSNMFPKKTKRGKHYLFLVASPNPKFISTLGKQLSSIKEEINIGEGLYQIHHHQPLKINLNTQFTLKTATPIVIRIPKYRYKEYGIESERPFEFWRPDYDFQAFIKQLTENLFKKFNQFHNTQVREVPLFSEFEYTGPKWVHPVINGKEVKMLGTYWKFRFQGTTEAQKKILQFGLDTGLGELNSLGMGFVNEVKKC